MLETIREYAAERLDGAGEADSCALRHARWFGQLATSAHGELRGPSEGEWLARLDADLENLRRAIRWAQRNDERLEVELAGATHSFLSVRGLLREALGYLVHALETAEPDPSLDRSGAAYMAGRTGDYTASQEWSGRREPSSRSRTPSHTRFNDGLSKRFRGCGGQGDAVSTTLLSGNVGGCSANRAPPEVARLGRDRPRSRRCRSKSRARRGARPHRTCPHCGARCLGSDRERAPS
jgi:hypothetical protein